MWHLTYKSVHVPDRLHLHILGPNYQSIIKLFLSFSLWSNFTSLKKNIRHYTTPEGGASHVAPGISALSGQGGRRAGTTRAELSS